MKGIRHVAPHTPRSATVGIGKGTDTSTTDKDTNRRADPPSRSAPTPQAKELVDGEGQSEDTGEHPQRQHRAARKERNTGQIKANTRTNESATNPHKHWLY